MIADGSKLCQTAMIKQGQIEIEHFGFSLIATDKIEFTDGSKVNYSSFSA